LTESSFKSDSPFVVGLTGGIGSGKSTIAAIFATCGAKIIDADAISHALTGAEGAGSEQIAAAFGAEYCNADGAVDRAALRKRVFGDDRARAALEAILHPLIRDAMRVELAASTFAPYVVWMVPLLIESNNARAQCHRVAVVDCPEQMQISRVKIRSGLTHEMIESIMRTQCSRRDRLRLGDDIIDNAGAQSQSAPQVHTLDRFYRQLASSRAIGA
jgi:dephospho-CoA kinase